MVRQRVSSGATPRHRIPRRSDGFRMPPLFQFTWFLCSKVTTSLTRLLIHVTMAVSGRVNDDVSGERWGRNRRPSASALAPIVSGRSHLGERS